MGIGRAPGVRLVDLHVLNQPVHLDHTLDIPVAYAVSFCHPRLCMHSILGMVLGVPSLFMS